MEKKLSLSQQIAEIGAGLKFEDLPERVVNNSKMFIMDLLGNKQLHCAGHSHDAAQCP